jgi:CelD/BcsL family acetyltransferase involved in cellulose biosynthesis
LLEFAGSGTVGSDYLDFIVRSTCEREGLDALTSFLSRTGYSVRLSNVKEGSAAAIAVSRGLDERGWTCLEAPRNVCPFIDLSSGSFDAYLSTLGSSHRYNFKRRLRNLNRDFTVRFAAAQSSEERRDALNQVVYLHLLRWNKRAGGSDAFNDPQLLAFHDDLTELARKRGWLRLFVLELDGRAVAAFYSFRYGRTVHFYQSGFDPAFEKYSVGLVALGLTVKSAIEEGAAEYDMLHGNETYKSLWATDARNLVSLEMYPPGPLGRLHRNTVRAVAAARKSAKRVLKAVS